MADEELPPVVARLVGDISDFEDSFGSAVAVMEALPGKAQQASTDLAAAFDGVGGAIGSEISAGLAESVAGAGTEAGSEILDGLTAEMDAAVERAATSGEAIGETFTESVSAGSSGMGTELVEQIQAALAANTAEMDDFAQQLMGQLRDLGAEAGGAFATAFAAAEGAAFSGLGAGAVGAGGALAAGLTGILAAALSDAAAEAGQAAGDALIAGVGDSASQGAGKVAAQVGEAVSASLDTAMAEAGTAAGDILVQSVQLAASQDLAAESAGSAFADFGEQSTAAVAAGMAEGVPAVQAAAERIEQVFNQLYMQGRGLSLNLSNAMTDAFEGIEVSTAQFAASETEIWNQFVESVNTEGIDAAIQRASLLAQQIDREAASFDPIAANVGTTGQALKAVGSDAEGAAAGVVGAGEAAAGAEAGFGGLGAAMGPVGMAAVGLMSVLPMLGGLFSSTAVSASDFTASVQQDSNAVGDNTAATIQSTLAKSDLSDISQQLGLSQAQLIEYAAGEKDVQDQVTAAYEKQSAALQKAASGQISYGKGSGTDGAIGAVNELQNQKKALDAVTAAVQQAVVEDAANSAALLASEQSTAIYNAAVDALGQSMMLNAQQTKMQNQAIVDYTGKLLAAGNEQSAFDVSLGASYDKMQLNAQASSQATVGLLGLGNNQFNLNQQLANSLSAYTEAQQGASAYNTVLNSLNGNTESLLTSQAAFTIALSGVSTAVQANGRSLSDTNAKGAQNIEVFSGIADKAKAAAVAVYQNEVSNVGANKAYDDANAKLEQEKNAFIAAAEKAHMNAGEVKTLADELFNMPKNISVGANTTPAINSLNMLLSRISDSSATVSVRAYGPEVAAKASGGPVAANNTYWVGEEGPELVTFGADGYVTPNDMLKPATAEPAMHASTAGEYGASGGAPIIINFNAGTMLGDEVAFSNAIQQAMGRLGLRVPNQYASISTTRGR